MIILIRKELEFMYVLYFECMLKKHLKFLLLFQCAKKFNVNWNKIDECSKDKEGEQLLKLNGDATNKLRPQVSFIPTISINHVCFNSLVKVYKYFICK